MAAASSLLLPCEFPVPGNRYNCQFKGTLDKGSLHSYSIPHSSNLSRRDAWSLHLFRSIHGPLNPVSTRCNVLLCRSVLKPGGGNEIAVLKAAAEVLTRSYNDLIRSPVVLQLIPAAGVIAFAAFGLGPLMRLSRILFLHETDSTWKKSSTHYIMSSYLQPVLLWTGTTLICRALDPVILPSIASQAVKQRLLNFVRSLSTVLAFAYCLSSLIQQTQKFFMEAKDTSDARNMGFEFAGKAVYTAVWIAAVSLFMELLGFSTQKWLTAGGLGTVLLTLAGREIFTNFLSSMMIHATRPFVLNDWIQTKIEGYEVSGTVEHVGWWSPTIIRGDDREAVHIPNHKFTVTVVRNLSQKTHWRIKTHLAISHLDVNKINNIVADMRKVLAKNPQIEQQRLHRRVFLDIIEPENQALMIMVSCFVKTSRFEEYLCVKEAVLLDLLRVISHHRARLATPLRTMHKVYTEADTENAPFAETIFSRNRGAVNRPLLLVEPSSYKVSSDDKIKSATRSVQINGEKDAKVEASKSSDTKDNEETGPTSTPAGNGTDASTSDSKVEVPKPSSAKADCKVDSNLALDDNKKDARVSSSKADTDTNSNSEASSTSTASSKISMNESMNSVQDNLEKQKVDETLKRDATTGAAILQSDDSSSSKLAADKQIVSVQELGSDTTDKNPVTSQTKQDGERSVATTSSVGRNMLEENIVLGVALEGSKRTLPIEDEVVPSPMPAESKDLAACTNRNGSSSPGNDNKDDTAGLPAVAPGDQREKQR